MESVGELLARTHADLLISKQKLVWVFIVL